MKNKIVVLISIITLIGLSGCARYKAQPLPRLTQTLSQNSRQGVSFAHHIFTKEDCKRYLDRDVLKEGYQPIHITLTNNTNRPLMFSLGNISLPTVPADEVAQKVYTDTTARAVSYGVAGIFIWPFLIPAVVDGVGSAKANEQLEGDFFRKTLCDQMVQPSSTINGLIFVPVKQFDPCFSLTMKSPESMNRYVLSTQQSYVTM